MIKIGFGSRVKPKTFAYVPRYYDPAKEELQERIKMYDTSETDGDEHNIDRMKSRIKTGMRMKHYGDASSRSAGNKKSNIRLAYIMGILFFAVYIILSSGKVIGLLEMFSK